jgi:hypothetical protein
MRDIFGSIESVQAASKEDAARIEFIKWQRKSNNDPTKTQSVGCAIMALT